MRHNSLKFKVSFYLSIVLSIAVVVFPLIFFQHRQEELLKVLSTHVTQISETIVASTRYTMLVNERDVAEQIINDIAKQKNIERVRVISKDGTIIHSNKRAEIGILSEHPTSQSVLGNVDVAYSLDEIDAPLNEHAIYFIATSLLCIVIFSIGGGLHAAATGVRTAQRFGGGCTTRQLWRPGPPDCSAQHAPHTTEAALSPLALVVEPLEQAPAVPASHENRARNIALFLAATFVGLAYFMFLPIVGTAMLL